MVTLTCHDDLLGIGLPKTFCVNEDLHQEQAGNKDVHWEQGRESNQHYLTVETGIKVFCGGQGSFSESHWAGADPRRPQRAVPVISSQV